MKDRDIDKDTVVAYHDFVQGKIKGELNGVALGPGRNCCYVAAVVFLFGLVSGIVGILVITLRTRHIYLWDWNDQFLGPFFVVLMLLCTGLSVYLIVEGKRRANAYRKDLVFRPIGDYGVAVVHKSRLNFETRTKEALKSGTTPHKPIEPKPYQPIAYDRDGRPQKRGTSYDNRGYRDERGPPPKYEEKPRMYGDDRDGRRAKGLPGDRPRPRHPDDRPRMGPDDRRRGPPPPGGRPRMGPDDRRRGPPGDRPRGPPGDRPRGPPGDRPRGPPGDRQRGPPDDRYRDRPRREGPPDDRYRDNRRRDDDLRRQERAREKEKEAMGEPKPPGDASQSVRVNMAPSEDDESIL